MKISLTVNGEAQEFDVPENTLLVEIIREHLGLTGTHVGWQCDGVSVTTIEGIGSPEDLHPMQAAFRECHALQCGFCTPGMIMRAIDLVENEKDLDGQAVREGLEGNLCRCTGYHNIVQAVLRAAEGG
jgi:carbon-monoxide dehydrogenase small subunit